MRRPMSSVAIAIGLVVVGCGEHKADDCERAMARVARIHTARSMRTLSAAASKEMLAGCRRGTSAAHDPVLRCAMDSASDETAAACMDAFVKAVVPPTTAPAKGVGVNPLLE